MAFDYVRAQRDQVLLLPVNMADWLEEGHLAWFVIDVVGRLDTRALHDRHPNNGAGRPAYDPDMMLALLLYAYANGMRSSRRIEAACRTDAAFRVISAGLVPDHATFARFVVDHEAAMEGLFVSGLRLCAAAGLVDLSTVAIDGTKMGANASLRANHSIEWVREAVAALMAATVASEEAEAPSPGAGCDPMSAAEIRGTAARLARLMAAQAQIEAEDAAAAEAMAARDEAATREAEAGRRLRGRKPTDARGALARAEADVAAARAKAQAKAQRRAAKEAAAAAGGRRLSGFAPGPDRRLAQAEAALGKARQAAAAANPAPGRRANVTDSDSRIMKTRRGYLQGYNAQVAADANQIVVAQMVSQDANDVALLAPMLKLLEDSITAGAISDALRKILADAGYWSDDNARLEGDLLIATLKDWKQRKAAREAGTTTGEPPEDASTLEAMEHRLRTAEGAAAYAKRSSTVEPVFGNHKANRNFPGFRRRGLSAVRAEWSFMNLSHNMGKLFDHWTPGSLSPA
jgi:transposase